MLKTILSIAGRPGLYRLVSNSAKNMLIVEDLASGKRTAIHSHEKVVSLGDISIYTADGGDVPLAEVLEAIKDKTQGAAIDLKAVGDLREYFEQLYPNFDQERVYTSDIRKLLSWYNILIANGVTEFKDQEIAQDEAAEEAEKTEEAQQK